MNFKKDFPFFAANDWVYLDSAATAQKPKSVIDEMRAYQTSFCATVHRAVYDLSQKVTEKYEETRAFLAEFLSCEREEVVFCKGTTDGINLIARSFSQAFLKKGDVVLLTEAEHHANLVPWQLLSKEKGIKLKFIPLKKDKTLDLSDPNLFEGVKLLSLCHISNVTGIENPIEEICKRAQEKKVSVLVDGAQAVAHRKVNVQKLGCDFYVFSAHKMYGPTGVGVIYGKKELLEKMPPVNGGGDMIEEVYYSHATFQPSPLKFEAGTPPIAEVLGLKKAAEYLENIGFEKIQNQEKHLYQYLIEKLSAIKGVSFFATTASSSILSFSLEGMHPLDVATLLNQKKIALRSGHLCAQPLLRKYKKTSLLRVSLGVYTSKEELDSFVKNLKEVQLLL